MVLKFNYLILKLSLKVPLLVSSVFEPQPRKFTMFPQHPLTSYKNLSFRAPAIKVCERGVLSGGNWKLTSSNKVWRVSCAVSAQKTHLSSFYCPFHTHTSQKTKFHSPLSAASFGGDVPIAAHHINLIWCGDTHTSNLRHFSPLPTKRAVWCVCLHRASQKTLIAPLLINCASRKMGPLSNKLSR